MNKIQEQMVEAMNEEVKTNVEPQKESKMNLEFNFSELLEKSATAYDNKGAYETLQAMMNRKEMLNVKFITDKDNYPAAWIESKRVAGFKYILKSESIKGLFRYLMKSEITDFDTDPMNIEPMSDEQKDFQRKMLNLFVESGIQLQFVPLFRDQISKISATANYFKGKVFFRLQRDMELLDYLREYKQAV